MLADRQISKDIHEKRRPVPLVSYFNIFFFFSDSLCVVFAEINLPTVYFHDTPNFVF